MIPTIAYILLSLGTGVALTAFAFFQFMAAAKLSPDPTVGGAYVALFMLSALPVFAAGSFAGAILFQGIVK